MELLYQQARQSKSKGLQAKDGSREGIHVSEQGQNMIKPLE